MGMQERLRELLPNSIFVSATAVGGLEPLKRSLLAAFRRHRPLVCVTLPAGDGRLLAEIYREGEVIEQKADGADGERLRVTARLDEAALGRLRRGGAEVQPA
jgi:GTP-binding protein HflX